MKNLFKFPLRGLGGFLVFGLLNSCGILPDALPDETQNGKNTFGCLINGKVFTTDEMTGDLSKGGLYVTAFKSNGSGISFYLKNLTKDGLGIYI
jgi:hypothetical protein